ncbi:uncharacterized protein LOC116245759 isoform X2 [Nymphaea colorata]|uniref:uncharacterized protein LOC116245759 isoform X2 n=1 Tax=Nymphaea colorata TaxID=210225 RepID=UPI00129E6E96|nr:uncharacterized protein LOC116245759 isoform X2 [Nymphaea colorata]
MVKVAMEGLKKSKDRLKLKKKKKSRISSRIEEEQQQQQKEELMSEGVETDEGNDSMLTMKKKKKRKLKDKSLVEKKVKKSKKGEGIKMKNDTKNDGVLQEEVDDKNPKVKKSGKMAKRKISQVLRESADAETDEANEVYEIPSVDDDCSKGMKKWVTEYHQRRPGLEILQQEIDDFIVAYETRKEKERKEREALAADGGWTVVTHHKGRKKTMDAESGIAVGSIAEAVVLEKIAKKKNKEPAKDFYRFQRREAQRNEVMMLQSKFEQDKKRIQQLKAARKFRPF